MTWETAAWLLVRFKGELEPANKTPFIYEQNKTTPSNSISYFSPNSFDKLDNRAVQVSKRNFTSLQRLVDKLIKVCETDIENTRVLFRWVVETDYKQRRSGRGPRRQSYHLLH
ncbi:uncharacterized protein LOC135477243 [Liolophura sinensis]|uniref:uncharacterized protein LOC135477243 n=1 Tax=Liolophura sinensis TaxID=3198878 RepID=UPI003158A00E